MLSSFSANDASATNQIVYLDFASSTPVDSRVLDAMLPYYISYYGNPAARLHRMGSLAEDALGEARQFFAGLLHADFRQTLFMSSATEANNFVLRGLALHPRRRRNRIVFAATEHSSIIETALALPKLALGTIPIEAVSLPVDAAGQVDLQRASEIIDDQTLCLCVMDVNNETGIVQNQLSQLIALAHRFGVHVHIDAVQGFVRSQFDASRLEYDSLVIASGKVYGPKGAASLALRPTYGRLRMEPLLTGGGQEFGWRSSTVNVPAVVGFAKAAQIQQHECDARLAHYRQCENIFLANLKKRNLVHTVHAFHAPRAPGILSLAFPAINAMKLIEDVPLLCVSVGSACRTLQATASHVLVALGVELEQALGSIRISFGTSTQVADIERGVDLLATAIAAMHEKINPTSE